ncbi:hypothetical protein U27_01787 [Candidatus Vecturithrix granuli]|uniref:DUF1638 domain-containing protein n=1 Tax=Vecturithrix granuli TaxID=1499967 RepID=A0A0S6W971_VECG1|nr:hypothetical protein U27_01787 [Candidatus Vecturithrix granuli]
MNNQKLLLVGCGILKREIRWLIEKNQWPVEAIFLNSALHVDFDKLARGLTAVLRAYHGRNIIVFYGCCHPLMDQMLEDAATFRTSGQNCLDILLGPAVFTQELSQRAFFLVEDWARRWNEITNKISGNNSKGVKYIFQCHHTYLLALRTPCSEDFTTQAEEVADIVGLPLRWMDVSLDHLESILQTTIMRKMEELSCQK